MVFSIALVEDDPRLQEEMQRAVSDWCREHQLDLQLQVFDGGEAFLQKASTQSYQLVIMDIYLTGMDGIETARRFRQMNLHSLLVFSTTSLEHMPQAFPCHAFDYLIKPVQLDQLHHTLAEAVQQLHLQEPSLTFVNGKQQVTLHYGDIYAVVSKQNYCQVQGSESFTARTTFSSVENSLRKDGRFCTINRGILVNLDEVVHFQDGICLMQDGTTYPLNTRRQNQLKQQLIEHRFRRREERMRRASYE